MNTRTQLRHKSNKKKRRVIWSIVIVILLAIMGTVYYEYQQLKPSNHFKTVPTLNTNTTKNKSAQSTPPSTLNTDGFNVLLIGSDERKTGNHPGHSDSMLIVHVDLKNNKYKVVSIPRDSRVYMDGHGYTKLTSVQYIGQAENGSKAGILDSINSISRLTGVPINYYAETNYQGLRAMVDTLGTIKVNVPFNVTLTHPWYPEDKDKVITKGVHTLDGKMVSELVHERDSVPGTDFGRQMLQERALIGIAKAAEQPSNFTKMPQLVSTMKQFVVSTNMNTSDMLSLALAVKNFDPKKDLKYYQLKGTSQSMYDDILQNNNDEVILDPQSIQKVMKNFK